MRRDLNRVYESVGTKFKGRITYLLDNLVMCGYLERLEDGSFSIPDPVVKYMAIEF